MLEQNFKELDDNALVARIQTENCSDSIEELNRRHAGLLTQVLQRYGNSAHCSGVSLQDLSEHKLEIVYKAAQQFAPDRNVKFATWLGNNARYFCLKTLKRESRYLSAEPEVTQYILDNAVQADDSPIREEAEYVISILDQIEDKRIKKIVMQRYFSENKKDRSFHAIGKKLNMSHQGVHNLHDTFMAFISEKIRARKNMDKV